MKPELKAPIDLFNRKRYEKALIEFMSIDEDPAEYPLIAYYMGLCSIQLERYDSAVEYLDIVVSFSKDFLQRFQSRMVLAYAYVKTRRFRLAEMELNLVLEEGYESVQTYSMLGHVLYKLKKNPQAIHVLRKAVRAEARNATALNSLAYILAEQEIDLATALEYARTAVNQNADNPSYLDTLGWVYYKMGDHSLALKFLRDALERSAGNKVIAAHLKEVMKIIKP